MIGHGALEATGCILVGGVVLGGFIGAVLAVGWVEEHVGMLAAGGVLLVELWLLVFGCALWVGAADR